MPLPLRGPIDADRYGSLLFEFFVVVVFAVFVVVFVVGFFFVVECTSVRDRSGAVDAVVAIKPDENII